MLTSNSGPMLGTLTPDRWGKRLRRFDKPQNATVRWLQIRSARRDERSLAAFDEAVPNGFEDEVIDGEVIPFVQSLGLWADEVGWLDGLLWEEERTFADEFDSAGSCSCRRCFIHDDPGGCICATFPEDACYVCRDRDRGFGFDQLDAGDFMAARALEEVDPFDLEEVDPFDLPGAPGWGTDRVAYEDFSSGFHIIDGFTKRPR